MPLVLCNSQVASFFDDVERDPYACMPDILFVYEVYTEHKAMLLYPINLLRNLARLQVMSNLVQSDCGGVRRIDVQSSQRRALPGYYRPLLASAITCIDF